MNIHSAGFSGALIDGNNYLLEPALNKIVDHTTKTVSVVDENGREVFTAEYVYRGGGTPWQRIAWTVHHYDSRGRHTQSFFHDATNSLTHWGSNDLVEYTIDPYGIKTAFTYDEFDRVKTQLVYVPAAGGDPEVLLSRTRHTYDADHRLIKVERSSDASTVADGSATWSVIEEMGYDKAGRVTFQKDGEDAAAQDRA